jgi:hypothetical protein
MEKRKEFGNDLFFVATFRQVFNQLWENAKNRFMKAKVYK